MDHNVNMKRITKRELLDKWIDENGPNGISRLAVESGVSDSTIAKARSGYVPMRHATRVALCRVLRIGEDDLFPFVEDKAS